MREKSRLLSDKYKNFRSTVFFKILLVLVSFLLICILLLFVVLSYASSRSLKEDYVKSNQLFLQQTERTVELTLDNMMTDMTNLLYSRDVIRGTVANNLLNYETTNSLLSLLASTSSALKLVDYIGYYVPGSDAAYDSDKIITTLARNSRSNILEMYRQGEGSVTRIRREDYICDIMAVGGKLYLFQSFPSLIYTPQSYIMFEVSADRFTETMRSRFSGTFPIVCDANYQPLVPITEEEDRNLTILIKESVLQSSDTPGFFSASSSRNISRDIFYARDENGWCYIYPAQQENRSLLLALNVFGGWTIPVFLLVIFGGFAAALYLVQLIYHPIRSLTNAVGELPDEFTVNRGGDELEYLSNAYRQVTSYLHKVQDFMPVIQSPVLEKLFLRIIRGERIPENRIREELEIMRSEYRFEDRYTIFLVSLDFQSPDSQSASGEIGQETIRLRIQQRIQSEWENLGPVFFLRENDLIAAILRIPENQDAENRLKLLRDSLHSLSDDSVTVFSSFGTPRDNMLSLRETWNEALNGLNIYRYYQENRESDADLSQDERLASYYSHQIREQIRNLSGEKLDDGEREIKALLSHICSGTMSIGSVRSTCQFFIIECRDYLLYHNISAPQALLDFPEEKHLSELTTIDDIYNYTEDACRRFFETADAFYQQTGYQKMEQARDIIREKYADPNLSLDTVAQAVGMSGSLLSHRFKAVYHCNFLTYLNEYRIHRAEELLLRTDMSIQEIGFVTGFQSMATFFRVFKKVTGLTPKQYRQNGENR